LKKIKKIFVLSEKDIPLTQQLTLLTMEKKNEIKVVSKELTKYLVRMTTTIDIEVYVYAESDYEAQSLAEQEVCVTEYANDTIGIEINRNWDCDLNREGDQKFELAGVSASGYTEAYDCESEGSLTLYAREEDGFDDSDKVFISEEDLLEEYEESDEEYEENEQEEE
jgi:hypothetical protein